MSDSVNLDTGGYGITQADINRVTNPFLDLEDALGGIFYFLEGHYDQIILEKIYSILTSALTENQKKIADTQTSVDETKEAYDLASAAYDVLRDLKLYDIQDLWDAISTIDQSSACKAAVNVTKDEILKLIYDLCKHEINGLNLDSLNMSFSAQSFASLAAALQAAYLTDQAATWNADQINAVRSSLEGMKNVVNGPIDEFDKSLSDQMDFLIRSISAAKAKISSNLLFDNQLEVIDEFLALASTDPINIGVLQSKLSGVKSALSFMSNVWILNPSAKSLVESMEEDIRKFEDVLDARERIADYITTPSDTNLAEISYQLSKDKGELSSLPGFADASSSINFYLDNSGKFTDAISALASISSANQDEANAAIAKVRAIEDLVTSAISAFTSSPTDENLSKVKCALRAIEYFPGASSISPSIVVTIADIENYLQDTILLQNAKAAIAAFNDATTPETFVDSIAEALHALDAMSNDTSTRSFLAGANISDILEKIESASELMGNVSETIDAFTSSESLIGANDRFNAVQDVFKEVNRVLSEKFSDSKLEDFPARSTTLRGHITNVNTFDSFYSNIDKLIAIFQTPEVAAAEGNPGHQSVKSYLYPSGNEPTNLYVSGSFNLAEPLTWAELTTLCNNSSLKNKLEDVTNNVVNAQATYNNAKKEYDELMKRLSIDPNMGINDLLNLCMMASTPTPQQDGSYRLVTGITRTIDANGNYTYALQYGSASLSKAQYDDSFSKQDGYVHYSLPYFALAIMYEKVGIQQLILVEQLKQIEKINEEMQTNNSMLKCLNWLYDKVYGKAASQESSGWPEFNGNDSKTNTGVSMTELHAYLKDTVKSNGFDGGSTYYVDASASGGKGIFKCAIAQYNRDGDGGGGETQNIDVKEQATLTMISNQQDNTRIYGDKLSTDSQLMTTKMSQYMQNSNACVSACSQVVKSIGDYFKTIASNIR